MVRVRVMGRVRASVRARVRVMVRVRVRVRLTIMCAWRHFTKHSLTTLDGGNIPNQ